jgi:hypothetical protein
MASTEDRARMGALLNAEAAATRTFAHEPGEGEAWWWLGLLAHRHRLLGDRRYHRFAPAPPSHRLDLLRHRLNGSGGTLQQRVRNLRPTGASRGACGWKSDALALYMGLDCDVRAYRVPDPSVPQRTVTQQSMAMVCVVERRTHATGSGLDGYLTRCRPRCPRVF